VQAAKAAPSSEHWKVEGLSLDVKPKLALVELLGLVGLELIVVSGGVVSTGLIVQV